MALACLVANLVFVLWYSMSDVTRGLGVASTVAVVILDILALSLMMAASGGVGSGLGALLFLPVAFGGLMIARTIAFLIPTSAAISSIAGEFYVTVDGAQQYGASLFQAAILGIAFFSTFALFRYLTTRARRRQEEAGLAMLDRMQRIAEASRREMEHAAARFDVLLSSSGEGVIGLDLTGGIVFANPRACQLLDIGYDEMMGRRFRDFLVEASEPNSIQNVVSLRRQKVLDLLNIEVERQFDPSHWQTANGERFMVEYTCEAIVGPQEEKTGVVILFQNVTEQKSRELELQRMAHFDPLTDLANRAYFNDALKGAISRSMRNHQPLGFLLVDVDHFKLVNESMGQDAGDELLKALGARLKRTVRSGDLVARFSGDQFAVLLADLDRPENAAVAAEKILQTMAEPIEIAGEPTTVSVSIGITISDERTRNVDEFASAAISALEAAKQQGRNTYCFFQPDIQRKSVEKRRLQSMLQKAVGNNEFKLVYQPIVSVEDRRIKSAEALLRWEPSDGGPIGPDVFIPIAEESGQINDIGRWVLQSVSAQRRRWQDELGACPSTAVNISSKQLKNERFREEFRNLLEKHEIPVESVELELTETGMMDDPEKCMAELSELRELGVKISIDDFGTGYSSLDYLRRLPLDVLKIDKSFTQGIGHSESDEEIIRVMIRMAHALGLQVICEGVETREQLRFLEEHDCDLVQGYLFSKPRSAESIAELFCGEADGSISLLDAAS